jgi:hypothetical protein
MVSGTSPITPPFHVRLTSTSGPITRMAISALLAASRQLAIVSLDNARASLVIRPVRRATLQKKRRDDFLPLNDSARIRDTVLGHFVDDGIKAAGRIAFADTPADRPSSPAPLIELFFPLTFDVALRVLGHCRFSSQLGDFAISCRCRLRLKTTNDQQMRSEN